MFKDGDLVEVDPELGPRTMWATRDSDDVLGYAFPGQLFIVSNRCEMTDCFEITNTLTGLSGWIDRVCLQLVK